MMNKLIRLLILVAVTLWGVSCGKRETAFYIDLIKYIDNSYTAVFEECLKEGLDAAGLVEGVDYRLRARSAQGEMSTLTMLVDSAVSSRSDLLITFQAPTLYTAIQRAPDVKKMFTLLQNPFIAGAGDSDTDHLPNLTGVYMIQPLYELLDLIAECRPEIRTLGVIYDPGDSDSEFRKDELVQMAAGRGMTVTAVPYTSRQEITLAADSLVSSRPQAVIHLQDAAQSMTFPVLYKTARGQKIPVFSLVYNMEQIGAVIACSTDRKEVGDRFAGMVARVIRGEDPSFIPFENDRDIEKRVGYNRTVATDLKLTLPTSLTTAP